MESLQDTLYMPPASHITSPACRIHQRPLLSPHLFPSCSTHDTGQVANQKICHGGKGKKPTPAMKGRSQSSLLGSFRRPLRSHEDRSSFLKLPFERTSECACYLGLHYATRAAPPDPLPQHQEHDRLWHVSMGSQD